MFNKQSIHLINIVHITKVSIWSLALLSSLWAQTSNNAIPSTKYSRTGDSLALAALFNSMDGSNWNIKTNWLSPSPIDEWHGVTVYNDRVITIYLGENNLSGSITSEIGNLNELITLSLYNNEITTIPKELGNLTKLKFLYLNHNKITRLPSEIGKLTNLENVSLSHNQITYIPAKMGSLNQLKRLYINNNKITSIAPELGDLTSLEYLGLEKNQLSIIPTELAKLSQLQSLYLFDNKISHIPAKIARIKSLNDLRVKSNSLDFSSLEPFYGKAMGSFYYLPQDSIGKSLNLTLAPDAKIGIKVKGSQNHYTWYRDNLPISPAIDADSINIKVAGRYHVAIVSDSIPELTLIHKTIVVTIQDSLGASSEVLTKLLNYSPKSVTLTGKGFFRIKIHSLMGQQKLLLQTNLNGISQIRMPKSLASGVYFLNIEGVHTKEIHKIFIP